MSKQLAISAFASILAMTSFALLATPDSKFAATASLNEQGATVVAAAPALDRTYPALFDIIH